MRLSNKKKIVIFGGSFNPPHYGHLEIAKTASKLIQPDKFIIVPNYSSPFKKDNNIHIDPYKKNKLVELMFEDEIENLSICTFEIFSNTLSYFYLTLDHIISNNDEAEFYLVIGYDQYVEFHKWQEYNTILSNVKEVLVFARNTNEFIKNHELDKYEQKIKFIPFDCKLSSTQLRIDCIDNTMTKPSIIEFINEHGLYITERISKYCSKKRYSHSLRVGGYVYYLAVMHNITNPKLLYFAGLYHDIAKDFNENLLKSYAEKISYINPNINVKLLHPYVGAYFIENNFKVKNTIILNAIARHTKPYDFFNHPPTIYDKLLYIADKLEMLRDDSDVNNHGINYYRKLAEENINQCFDELYDDVQQFFK